MSRTMGPSRGEELVPRETMRTLALFGEPAGLQTGDSLCAKGKVPTLGTELPSGRGQRVGEIQAGGGGRDL